jgi:hypothetical protein
VSLFLLAVPAGLLAGLALGGRVDALASLRLRWTWLFGAALALQIVAFPSGMLPWSLADRTATALWLASYVLLAVAACANLRLRGAGTATLGMGCNLAAILSNGGHMPALPGALEAAGLSYGVHNNSVSDGHPHLALLVDRFAAPAWLPAANVLSVGDLLIVAGAAVLIAAGMGARLPRPPLPAR